MSKKTANHNDPGFGYKYKTGAKRTINKDGSFNAKRIKSGYSPRNTYQTLIHLSWPSFLLVVIGSLILINGIFALLYLQIGIENLNGVIKQTTIADFLNAFYFSFQTFTTVGYGHLSPNSGLISFVAALEAMIGLMCFALVTGLIYGRFSRPTARLLYSKNALISPHKKGLSLQFRVANKRMSMLMEMHATVILQLVDNSSGELNRKFHRLDLERESISFFPLNWTIVHPITEKSPLFGKSMQDLEHQNAEVLIMLKGFDDTFGQQVHSRYSYLSDELVWEARFLPAYYTDKKGRTILNMKHLHHYIKVSEPE